MRPLLASGFDPARSVPTCPDASVFTSLADHCSQTVETPPCCVSIVADAFPFARLPAARSSRLIRCRGRNEPCRPRGAGVASHTGRGRGQREHGHRGGPRAPDVPAPPPESDARAWRPVIVAASMPLLMPMLSGAVGRPWSWPAWAGVGRRAGLSPGSGMTLDAERELVPADRHLELRLGSARWMAELGVDLQPLATRSAELQALGRTVSWLADVSGAAPQLLGLLAFGDRLRACALARSKQSSACRPTACAPCWSAAMGWRAPRASLTCWASRKCTRRGCRAKKRR